MKMKAKKFLKWRKINDEPISNGYNGSMIKLSDLMEQYHQAKSDEKKIIALNKIKKVIDYDDSDQAEIEIDASVGIYNKHFE